MRHKYTLGKCDGYGNGRKSCLAVINWELKDGAFSMSAEVWNSLRTDIIRGGQCVDEVAAYFPHDMKAARMVAIWRRWHLNNLRAGTPKQEAKLKELSSQAEQLLRTQYDGDASRHFYDDAMTKPNWHSICRLFGFQSYYEWACQQLEDIGILEDAGHKYGTAWLTEELPPAVVAEIESWSAKQ